MHPGADTTTTMSNKRQAKVVVDDDDDDDEKVIVMVALEVPQLHKPAYESDDDDDSTKRDANRAKLRDPYAKLVKTGVNAKLLEAKVAGRAKVIDCDVVHKQKAIDRLLSVVHGRKAEGASLSDALGDCLCRY